MTEVTVKKFALTQAERESFEKNGFIGPFTAYTPEEMQQAWKRARLRLLDRRDEDHPDDLFSGPLDPVAPHEAGQEEEEQEGGEKPAESGEDRLPLRRRADPFPDGCSSPPHAGAGV